MFSFFLPRRHIHIEMENRVKIVSDPWRSFHDHHREEEADDNDDSFDDNDVYICVTESNAFLFVVVNDDDYDEDCEDNEL